MKREENVEVGVEPLGIVAQANANIVLAAQLPLAAANLLSEVRASRREQLVPGCAAEAEHRAAGAPQDLRPEKRRPSFSRRHVLAEEEVESLVAEGGPESTGGLPAICRSADRAEVVGLPVPEEPDQPEGPLRREV